MKKTLFLSLLFTGILSLVVSCEPEQPPAEASSPASPNVLIFGGGSSHDFDRWFNQEDINTLKEAGITAIYSDNPQVLSDALPDADILILTNNQPLPDSSLRLSIFEHANAGKGLLLIHPAVWYNWEDWPVYNEQLVGGGSRSHLPYGQFESRVVAPDHPIMAGVPSSFSLEDELYRFEANAQNDSLLVLAVGIDAENQIKYPIAWVLPHPTRRIVGITLGHDGYTHQSDVYQTILVNSVLWLFDHSPL